MKALQLIKEGKKSEALVYINNYLKGNPNDPQMLFWKAKILNDSYISSEKEEGFQLYLTLSDNYPELAEPHNNLGVIFAAQGDYAKAIHYFELALRANPTYSIASENLADLYAQQAANYYKNAVDYDSTNKTARAKLEKINAKPTSPGLLSPPHSDCTNVKLLLVHPLFFTFTFTFNFTKPKVERAYEFSFKNDPSPPLYSTLWHKPLIGNGIASKFWLLCPDPNN